MILFCLHCTTQKYFPRFLSAISVVFSVNNHRTNIANHTDRNVGTSWPAQHSFQAPTNREKLWRKFWRAGSQHVFRQKKESSNCCLVVVIHPVGTTATFLCALKKTSPSICHAISKQSIERLVFFRSSDVLREIGNCSVFTRLFRESSTMFHDFGSLSLLYFLT